MSAFVDLTGELVGILPGLSPLLAETHINRAWRDVRDERNWSFLNTDGAVVCPVQVVAGTAAIVQFSDQVTMNAVASAALAAGIPAIIGLTRMQIRFGGGGASFPTAGQIYSIVAVDTINPAYVLTLDRMVIEPTNAASTYQCYRCYIPPPSDDFIRWTSFVDVANAQPIKRDYSSVYFDTRDPQRGSQGLASYVGFYQAVSTGDQLLTPGSAKYELWPHPASGQAFYVRYRRRGTNFLSQVEELPDVIPDGLIIQRALGWYAYAWAQANVGHFPTMKSVNWPFLIAEARMAYTKDLLIKAKRQDEELTNSWIISRGGTLRHPGGQFPWPIDSNFLQSHLVNF